MKNYDNPATLVNRQSWKRNIIPVVIILVGVLISGIIFYVYNKDTNDGIFSNKNYTTIKIKDVVGFVPGSPDNVAPISTEDHILGNPNAPVKIVEFSDLECPFCKVFHITMQKIMEEYGKRGEVAWVYRHFPVDQIHSKARTEATAAECADEIGGQGTFWDYISKVFEITPSNNGLDLTLLPQIAEDVGVDRVQFEECLVSRKYDEHIESNFQNAINSGANGTPYSIVIAPNGEKYPILGSQTYSSVALIIDLALKGK